MNSAPASPTLLRPPLFDRPLYALDFGNTQITVGAWNAGRILARWHFKTEAALQDPNSFWNEARKTWLNPTSLATLVCASVAPEASSRVQRAKPDGVHWYDLQASSPFSFRNETRTPEKVGIDRLVNAEAAFREWGAPCLILDIGTATTLCALTQDHVGPVFRGGMITPGPGLLLQALHQKTALLPPVSPHFPQQSVGRTTKEAIQSGVFHGHTSLILGLIARFRTELNLPDAPVILTGGWASLFEPHLRPEIDALDSDLTLKGIASLYASISA